MLCGQPEQKCGVRTATSPVLCTTAWMCSSFFSRAAISEIVGIGEDAPGDGDGDLVRFERAPGGKQHAVLLVLLADHHRRAGAAVKLLLDLRLDQRALLLDDEDRLAAPRRSG